MSLFKHTFRHSAISNAPCLKCHQPADHESHWREGEGEDMDVIEELETMRAWRTDLDTRKVLVKAISEIKELRAKVSADSHLLPRRMGCVSVNVGFLEKWLKLPPDHYVDSVFQDGQDRFTRQVRIVIIGPDCPQTLFGERIPDVLLIVHTDKEFSTIEGVK